MQVPYNCAAVAELAERELVHDCKPILWSQGVFRTNNVPIEDLMHSLQEYDFAVFILLPEDPMQIRDTKTVGVRDNVLFERGLFLGKLGRKRIFFIGPESEQGERTVAAPLAYETGATPPRHVPVEQLVRLGLALQTNQAAPVSVGPRAENEASVAELMDAALAQNRN
jgi:hypothetical protein